MKRYKMTPKVLEWLILECAGKGSGFEDEFTLTEEMGNPDFVEVGGTALSRVGKVLKRCGSEAHSFVMFRNSGKLTQLWVRFPKKTAAGKRLFRGADYAFANIDGKKTTFPKDLFGSAGTAEEGGEEEDEYEDAAD